ncbi:MAG: DUF6029 family protein [Chitinophagales bacterium]|nr:DUF6029 family protein [Chitinophagales bacterium]
MKRILVIFFLLFISPKIFAQYGTLSGDLQTDLKIFQRDSAIGATNTPQYDNYLSGLESWLTVNYSIAGFNAHIRFDAFHNSNLFDPSGSYTGAGIGYFNLQKEIGKLTVTGGYFYEQYGSGIVFRSYEDRGLGLDYATFGISLKYQLNDNWVIKGLAGQQKNQFTRYNPVFKGLNVEGNLNLSDKIKLAPGAAFLNRTMDQASMDNVVNVVNGLDSADRFVPKYNVYAFSGYYTLSVGDFSWYTEGAYKTHEAIYDATGTLVDKPGNVVYSSLAYSRKGLGITTQVKRTENFVLRTSPNETLLKGVLDFLPPMSRQNSLRLPARYTPATQYLGELAIGLDAVYTPTQGYQFEFSYSDIHDLDQNLLWREAFAQLDITKSKKHNFQVGLQYVFYNQTVYRSEPLPDLTAFTPFAEYTYKISRKNSLRFELQYQHTEEDYGSFIFALAEYNIAPRLSFSISDMYNLNPNPAKTEDKIHYYNFFMSYTKNANRFALSYARQIAGVNCSGGVCRYEPAFSGVKLSITSTF